MSITSSPTDLTQPPQRPQLAVSAAIVRAGAVLVMRRAHPPAIGHYSFPGGRVEWGESLDTALRREVQEETGLLIAPGPFIGFREVVVRDGADVSGHFVIACFAVKWTDGEVFLNDEHTDARWLAPADIAALPVTDGLPDLARSALATLGS